jgi:hypothetical protein
LLNDAVADRAGSTVAGAAHNHAVRRETQALRRFRREAASHFIGFFTTSEQRSIQLELRQKLLRPAAMYHVEQQHAAGVADFGREFAG